MTLEYHEALFVKRRRKNLSQTEMAELFGVAERTYRRWERGVGTPRSDVRILLTPSEMCYILRRRIGMSQQDLAERLGVSRQWVNYMELDLENNERLREYWGV